MKLAPVPVEAWKDLFRHLWSSYWLPGAHGGSGHYLSLGSCLCQDRDTGDIPILPKGGLRKRKFNLLSEVVVKLGSGPCLFKANSPSFPHSSLYKGNAHPECVSNRLLGRLPVLSHAREFITQTGI